MDVEAYDSTSLLELEIETSSYLASKQINHQPTVHDE
jgi:hypothetical protein